MSECQCECTCCADGSKVLELDEDIIKAMVRTGWLEPLGYKFTELGEGELNRALDALLGETES